MGDGASTRKELLLPACFIIAPTGTKLDPLTRVVRDAGWRILNLESVERGTSAFLNTTITLIARSDAVLVVLTDNDSPNTLVETGVALGLGRPVLLIAEDAAISDRLVPDRLLIGLPRVRATLADSEALRFHVGAFLDGTQHDHPNPAAVSPSVTSDHGKTGSSRLTRPESQIEGRLLAIFEQAVEIEAVRLEPNLGAGRRFRPDFALWLRDPRQVIPNPLIVEFVGQEAARRGTSKRRLDQLEKYAFESGFGAVMLVEDVDQRPLSLLRLSPMTFRVGLSQLKDLLAAEQFVPEMVRERNLLAHSAG